MESYGLDGAVLEAISAERTPFLDLNCGSLAQGLSGGIGFALAAQRAGDGRHTWVFICDGEMEEGQPWEAAMFAAQHRLDNLTVLICAPKGSRRPVRHPFASLRRGLAEWAEPRVWFVREGGVETRVTPPLRRTS